MNLSIQNIISLYLKVPAEQITDQTIVDRSAVGSSIMLHRMYAHLAKEGFSVSNYWEIRNFSTLLQSLTEIPEASSALILPQQTNTNNSYSNKNNNAYPIGIDIQQISLMPPATDYREDAFYALNFGQAEIAYCILQSNPMASFAGLFAAKEAIVKADNQFINQPFYTIVIDHMPNGRPVHPYFSLSISHSADFAVAVAFENKLIHTSTSISSRLEHKFKPTLNLSLLYIIAFSALLISLILLILFISK